MSEETKQKILDALEEKEEEYKCPVCEGGWKVYRGNYDELCDKHYLEIEPT